MWYDLIVPCGFETMNPFDKLRIHGERRRTMKSSFPKITYERNATIYKLLANPKRLEILNLLK
ncbi:MAG: hypothetical protein A3E55_03890 [Candidatus Ryanbacteria bacterium RIFCSPHIGHO2_12_FULL_44_20]|nr:MAG: hypothetical protein A3E55_03890 [Candidatus Ryanbacteria bacterium RIFCSPHIGHO2_12_FULL_44_20]